MRSAEWNCRAPRRPSCVKRETSSTGPDGLGEGAEALHAGARVVPGGSVADLRRKYVEAVEREQFIRETAFLPVSERIGPFEVLPMTLRHFLCLRSGGSPFVCGGTVTDEDVFEFLWVLSPRYGVENVREKRKLYARCRKWFLRGPRGVWRALAGMVVHGLLSAAHSPRGRGLGHPEAGVFPKAEEKRAKARLERLEGLIGEVREFVSEAMQDQPPSGEASSGPSYWGDGAAICETMATEYGWTVPETLDLPLKQLFQFLKVIRARERAKAGRAPVMFNPSDRMKAELAMAV